MVCRLDNFLGREPLLARGGRPADGQQPRNRGDGKARTAMQEEMAEQPRGEIIGAGLLAEAECRPQECGLLDGLAFRRHTGLSQPLGKRAIRARHGYTSLQPQVVYPVATGS